MSTSALQRRSTVLFGVSIAGMAASALFGFMLTMAAAMAPAQDGVPYSAIAGAVFAVAATVCSTIAMRRGFDTQGVNADPAIIRRGWRFLGAAAVLLLIGIVLASLNLGAWHV